MARRRRSSGLLVAGVLTPVDLSGSVIGTYVSKAKDPRELGRWAGDYRKSISAYVADARKQELAKAKLAAWYELFVTTVVPALREAYSRARVEYVTRKIEAVTRAARGITAGATPPA